MAYLAALRCADSILSMSSVVLRYQTEVTYSSCGRMWFLNAVAFKSLLWTLILRLRKPGVWLNFLVITSMFFAFPNPRSSDFVTPRYFNSSRHAFKFYIMEEILRRHGRKTGKHEGPSILVGLKFMSQSSSHFSGWQRSF